MLKKKKLDRKQKRIFRRILFFSLLGLGLFIVVGSGAFLLVKYQLTKPLYVSPLASIKFMKESGADRKLQNLKKALQKEDIQYSSIRATDDTYIITLKKGGEVTFSTQKDIMSQIASLQYILSHLTMEGKLFSHLDLRFDKPVIVLRK